MREMSAIDLGALRARRGAIAGVFFVQGLVFISLTTRLPQVQHRFDLSSTDLSLELLLVVLASGLGSVAAEKIASGRESATALRLGLSSSPPASCCSHRALVVLGGCPDCRW